MNPSHPIIDPEQKSVIDSLAKKLTDELFNRLDISLRELNTLTDKNERAFIKHLLSLRPSDFGQNVQSVGTRKARKMRFHCLHLKIEVHSDTPKTFTQDVLIPLPAWQAWQKLTASLYTDKRLKLRVTSAYRTDAYQILLICYYLSRNKYDAAIFNRIALPGYSEHGDYDHPAFDIESDPPLTNGTRVEFSETPHYAWLQKNAKTYGFHLSYGKNNRERIFEPWHWRYSP